MEPTYKPEPDSQAFRIFRYLFAHGPLTLEELVKGLNDPKLIARVVREELTGGIEGPKNYHQDQNTGRWSVKPGLWVKVPEA